MTKPLNGQILDLYNSTNTFVQNLPNQVTHENISDILENFSENMDLSDNLLTQIEMHPENGGPLPEQEKQHMLMRTFMTNQFVVNLLTVDELYSDEDAFQISNEAKSFFHNTLTQPLRGTSVISDKYHSKVERLIFENHSEVVTKAIRDDVRDFTDEAEMLVRLDHPHIIKLYSVLIRDDRITELYLEPATMNLFERMQVPNIWQEQGLNFLNQILLALRYLAKQEIVHGDIKPENILLNKKNEIKLTDFGISLGEGDELDVICSLAYRPPEVRNLESPYTPKVDIWSLGVTFFEWMKDKNKLAHPSKTMWTQDIKPYLKEPIVPKTTYQGENLKEEVEASLKKIQLESGQDLDPIQKISAFIARTMVWSPQERSSAEELLNEFFKA